MSEYFFDSLVRQSNSEKEIQALRVKLPFMDNFCPVLEVKEIREEPDFLLIRIASEAICHVLSQMEMHFPRDTFRTFLFTSRRGILNPLHKA